MRTIHPSVVAARLALVLALALWGVASAADDASDNQNALQEITITAQRRAQSSQDVPIAVTAFSTEELKAIGATSTGDLPQMVPGLQLAPTAASTPIFLRGVGNDNNSNVGSAVLIFIDGVYYPYQQGDLPFSNVESVEVDKGPQGTLFGRNATGGVIQITTQAPQFTPSGNVEVGYGNFDTLTGSLYATTGVTKNLAGSIAAYYEKQNDGWGTNLANGMPVFTNKDAALRNEWLYRFSPDTKARISFDYLSSDGTAGTDILAAVGYPFLYNEVTGTKFNIPGQYNVDANYQPEWEARQMSGSVRLDTRIGDLRGVSITSWHSQNVSLFIDYDGTPIPFLNLYRLDKRNAETQEFQLLSPDGSRVTWVAGLFFYNDTGQMEPFQFGGLGGNIVFGAPPGEPFQIYADDRLTSYAGYGQATFPIVKDTNLTLGARYTIDQRYITGANYAGPGQLVPGSAASESQAFRKPTFRAVLDHHFTPDFMGYASYNRGFNSGYFNQVATSGFAPKNNPAVNPEIMDAYEVGAKTEWFEHRLRLNVSGFWYNYKNLQQQVYEGEALVTINAAAARIRGVDLDIEARPLAALTVGAGLEYLNGKFESYPGAPIYSLAPSGALISVSGDAAGETIPYAPDVSGNVRAAYTIPSAIGDFDTAANVAYTAAWYADPSNVISEPAHTLLNASETWTSSGGSNYVTLWGKNLTNRRYDVGINILAPVAAAGNPGAPRTYGIKIGHRF